MELLIRKKKRVVVGGGVPLFIRQKWGKKDGSGSALEANNLTLVQDLLCLEHLKLLEISIYSVSALEMLLTSAKLLDCTRGLSLQHLRNRFLYVPSFLKLRHLEELRIADCQTLEEITKRIQIDA